MRKTNTFSPTVSEALETRAVPSTFGFSTPHAFVFTRGALSTPVVHPPGTFSNGVPTVHVASNGERFTLGGVVSSTRTVKPAVSTPAPVLTHAVTPPVVVHPPGTFSNGYPTVHVAADGERFTLGHHFGR